MAKDILIEPKPVGNPIISFKAELAESITLEVLTDGSVLFAGATVSFKINETDDQIEIGGPLVLGNVTGTADTILAIDTNKKIIDTGVKAVFADFDLIDFITLTDINADTDTVIPANYRIVSIVFEETSVGSPISSPGGGTIDVGTTTGATDIVNGATISLDSFTDAAIGTDIFSTTSSQMIYIESADWTTMTVTVHIRIEKFAE